MEALAELSLSSHFLPSLSGSSLSSSPLLPAAVTSGDADFFLWEKFMTKPFVDSGELATLGHLDSPWHCFGFVARQSWLRSGSNRALLRSAAQVALSSAAAFLEDPASACEGALCCAQQLCWPLLCCTHAQAGAQSAVQHWRAAALQHWLLL